MSTVLVVLLLVLVAAVVAATAVLRSGKRQYAQANEVVPGAASRAPAEWAGAHTPEARLHRRLRDAVAGLRANPALEDAWALEARVTLEQQALAVDDRLVAVAALPARVRAEPLAAVSSAVDAVEAAVAALADSSQPAPERSRLDQAMTEVQDRVAVLEQGRLTEPGV